MIKDVQTVKESVLIFIIEVFYMTVCRHLLYLVPIKINCSFSAFVPVFLLFFIFEKKKNFNIFSNNSLLNITRMHISGVREDGLHGEFIPIINPVQQDECGKDALMQERAG